MKTFTQQPTPVPPQIEIPAAFPEIPPEVIERFPAAADWQRRLDEFWTRTSQALQQAQSQTAAQINSTVVFNVDTFRIYAKNGIAEPMFALDAAGVKLGDVLVISTAGRKVFIGVGEYANDNTPFYIDTLGNFSLGANLTWDPTTSTLNITGVINATSGTIGGFDIGADYIRDSANSFGLASAVTGGDDVRFWAGDTFANRATAPFRIYESGIITVGPGASYQYNNVKMISAITTLANYFFGNSGNFTMTGVNNLALGSGALASNTTGNGNQAMGTDTLTVNTTGSNNVAVGANALKNNNAVANVAVGFSALQANTSGANNLALGINALILNQTGHSNVAVGNDSLSINVAGINNVAIGTSTLIGYAGAAGTGANTAVGFFTGGGIATGTGNTILGANVSGLAGALTNNIILAIGTGVIKAQFDGTTWVFTGGINGTNIGATTPGTGAFTTLSATGNSWIGASGGALRTINLDINAVGANDGASLGVRKKGNGFATIRLSTVGDATGYDLNFNFPNTGDLGIYDLAAAASRFIIDSSGNVTIPDLAGVGTRNVVADANGVLSAP